jgi:hypothetical protein
MITKQEVHVLQEVVAKQCMLTIPYSVAEAALYEIERCRQKWMKDIAFNGPAGSPAPAPSLHGGNERAGTSIMEMTCPAPVR